MPKKSTPRFKFAYGWLRGEDYWGDPTSVNRVMHDALLHPYIISMTTPTPPTAPNQGDQYIIPLDATDDWEDETSNMAIWVEDTWIIIEMVPGVRVMVTGLGPWWFDGTDWLHEPIPESTPGQGTRYDIAVSVGFPPEAGDTLLLLPLPQAMSLPVDAVGSYAVVDSPPPTEVVLSVLRNGVQVATVKFEPLNFNGIISVPAEVLFAPGDKIKVTCPAVTLPPGFQDFGIMLRLNIL